MGLGKRSVLGTARKPRATTSLPSEPVRALIRTTPCSRTRAQRCWFHKVVNVVSALPKSAHPGAKAALAEIYNAEDKRHAQAAATAFADTYGAKFPKATAKITDDLNVLLTFYDYPAEHWIHPRTTNPIESTFATVGHRIRVNNGRAAAPPGWSWRSNSSSPPRNAGARSTHPIWSPSSAPEPPSATDTWSTPRPGRRMNRHHTALTDLRHLGA